MFSALLVSHLAIKSYFGKGVAAHNDQNCSCTLALKGPSFLVTFHIIKNEVYFYLRGTLYCMKVISLRSFPISA